MQDCLKIYDVRQEIRSKFEKACRLLREERKAILCNIFAVGELYELNAAVNLNISDETYLRKLGLSKDQYYKRAMATKVMRRFPVFKEMLVAGETHLSIISMLNSKITQANAGVIVDNIRGKSKREVMSLLSRIDNSGNINDGEGVVEITLTLTDKEAKLLEAARDVLASRGKVPRNSEILVQSLEDLLDKRDPRRRAQRAEERRSRKSSPRSDALPRGEDLPSKPVMSETSASDSNRTELPRGRRPSLPRKLIHQVWQRDGGRCTHRHSDGVQCGETMMLEIDHIKPWASGGCHRLENLRLLCKKHNLWEARLHFGMSFIEGFK